KSVPKRSFHDWRGLDQFHHAVHEPEQRGQAAHNTPGPEGLVRNRSSVNHCLHAFFLQVSCNQNFLQEMAMTSAIRLRSANPARATCEYSQRSRNCVQSGGRVSFSSRDLCAPNEKKPELKRSGFRPQARTY